jgi:hypothetical protein
MAVKTDRAWFKSHASDYNRCSDKQGSYWRMKNFNWGSGLNKPSIGKRSMLAAVFLFTVLLLESVQADSWWHKNPAPKLLDLSGLAWIGGDRFLAVSDAKYPAEPGLNRVSILTLPNSLDGVGFEHLKPAFPGRISSDLESAARIPNSSYVLLAESGDDNRPGQRIFLARVEDRQVSIEAVTEWRSFTEAFNIEASAVARTGEAYVFLWAERNSGNQGTDIKWVSMEVRPFRIGGIIESVSFTLPAKLSDGSGGPLFSRPIVGMDLDSAGNLYTVAAYDPEGTVQNPDNGPYRSAVLKIGQFTAGRLLLDETPSILAMVDGFKAESIAVRDTGKEIEFYVGTDDENFGGVLRRIKPLDSPCQKLNTRAADNTSPHVYPWPCISGLADVKSLFLAAQSVGIGFEADLPAQEFRHQLSSRFAAAAAEHDIAVCAGDFDVSQPLVLEASEHVGGDGQ